jgi:hypothetical protein
MHIGAREPKDISQEVLGTQVRPKPSPPQGDTLSERESKNTLLIEFHLGDDSEGDFKAKIKRKCGSNPAKCSRNVPDHLTPMVLYKAELPCNLVEGHVDTL